MSRSEFIEYVSAIYEDTSKNSPLWIPEQATQSTCDWFIITKGSSKIADMREYHNWCVENLQGEVLCFWWNDEDNEQAIGFTNLDDIPLWILRWA